MNPFMIQLKLTKSFMEAIEASCLMWAGVLRQTREGLEAPEPKLQSEVVSMEDWKARHPDYVTHSAFER